MSYFNISTHMNQFIFQKFAQCCRKIIKQTQINIAIKSIIYQQLILFLLKIMQTAKFFKEKKGVMEVAFALSQTGDSPTLNIQLINSKTCNRYRLIINEQYIQTQDSLFTSNIESVAELYDHLIAEFERLILTEDGAIIFELEVMIKKKVEKKAYRLEGEKQVSEMEELKFQIQEMRKQMMKDSERKDQRIIELEQRQNRAEIQNQKQIQALWNEIKQQNLDESTPQYDDSETAKIQLLRVREEIERSWEMIKMSQKETNILIEEQKCESDARIRQMMEETGRFGEGLARINRFVEEHQNKILEIVRITDKLKQEISKNEEEQRKIRQFEEQIKKKEAQRISKLAQIRMHTQNPHRDSFKVKEDSHKITIIKVGLDSKNMCFFGSSELQKDKVHSFQIKQVRTSNQYIMLGIASKSTFGVQNAYKHKQTMSYYSKDGNLYREGSYIKGGSPVSDGSVVDMVVDLSIFTVKWFIDGKLQATANMCADIRSSRLFLFVLMYNTGDEVHLLM